MAGGAGPAASPWALQAPTSSRSSGAGLTRPLLGPRLDPRDRPMVTGIVVDGAAGTAITADVSARKVHEELDALQVLGVDRSRTSSWWGFSIAGPFDMHALVFGIVGGIIAELAVPAPLPWRGLGRRRRSRAWKLPARAEAYGPSTALRHPLQTSAARSSHRRTIALRTLAGSASFGLTPLRSATATSEQTRCTTVRALCQRCVGSLAA